MNDDSIWCPGCGRMQPWKHKHEPTLKARVAKRLLDALSKLEDLVTDWRDSDAKPSVYADRKVN